MSELPSLFARFMLGGCLVSLFSVFSESFKPKSFAGIFGAAPSLAIAGFVLILTQHGPDRVATEAHSMIFGAIALTVYSLLCALLLAKTHLSPYVITVTLYLEWLIVAYSLYALVLR